MARYIDDDGSVNRTGIARLTKALLADRKRADRRTASPLNVCFLCGRGFIYRGPNGDDSARFCSARCRESYDHGRRASTSHARQTFQMRMGRDGFWIECANCSKQFESKGWRFCQPQCARSAHQQAETASVLAEVNMEAPTKRRCQKPGCSRSIPNWRHGRRVSSAAKFCDVHNRSRSKGSGRA
jgi:hypothetical protein